MDDPAEALAGRVFDMAVHTFDLLSVALGNALGYYQSLAQDGAMTAAELAVKTGTAERYAREWLEQQAATGFLELATSPPDSLMPRFRLAAGATTVFASPDDLNYLAPLTRQLAAAARQLPSVIAAARTGTGVSWEHYGADMRESEGISTGPPTCTYWQMSGLPHCPTYESG